MATLHVRNVPHETYEALRRLASDEGSSISVEVVRLLQRALRTDRPRLRHLLDQIEAERPVVRRKVPGAAELIRQDRDAR